MILHMFLGCPIACILTRVIIVLYYWICILTMPEVKRYYSNRLRFCKRVWRAQFFTILYYKLCEVKVGITNNAQAICNKDFKEKVIF